MTTLVVSGLKAESEIIASLPGVKAVADYSALTSLAQFIDPSIKGIMSFGVCGALKPGLPHGGLLIPASIITSAGEVGCDLQWALSHQLASGKYGNMKGFSDAKIGASDPASRAALYRRTGCAFIDNESWAAAQLAQKLGLPFIVVRAVSDVSDQTVTVAPDQLNADGSPNIPVDVEEFFVNPAEVIHEAQGFERALETLRWFVQRGVILK